MAVVDGDHVDPAQDDRARRLDDAATVSVQRERARQHEPRVGDQKRAARSADAMEVDPDIRRQLTHPGDHCHPVTRPHEPGNELGQLTLHPPHRADVVRDDRDLARGPDEPTLPNLPGRGLLVGDRSHDLIFTRGRHDR